MPIELASWLILLLPLGSFLIIGVVIRPFLTSLSNKSGYLAAFAIAGSLAFSLWILRHFVSDKDVIFQVSYSWFSVGDLEIPFGILMDPLTVIMLVVVTSVSLMIQIYSFGYMRHNTDAYGKTSDSRGYARYFAYMSLFTASMIGLVLASSIIQLYFFWELVGLSSYLLIGFWYHRPSAAAAAKKAFIITRFGDFGFLLAILYLFMNQETFLLQGLSPFEIEHIQLLVSPEKSAAIGLIAMAPGIVTWIALGLFAGAVGKSAQFPLHTWLPDAMEGPTSVSALIHAATMVAAGVFLVARFYPVFEASTTAMNTVAIVGAVTAIMAASMGLVMFDIKRVLAYSTISQLGFMMLALGIGAYGAAIFHLFNHAFFKALLFLGAGSVNHATGTFDMRYMGGLRSVMPWTYRTFLIAAASIAGIPLLSGFWSKDEIMGAAFGHGGIGDFVFWIALIAAFFTAVYIFRVVFMTFHGEFRGGETTNSDDHNTHLKESPLPMILPMMLLAIPAFFSGFFVNPPIDLGIIPKHWFSEFLGIHHTEGIDQVALALSTVIAISGVLVAYLIYQRHLLSPERITNLLLPFHRAATKKYYVDDIYEEYITKRIFYRYVSVFLNWFDSNIVDGVVDLIAWVGRNAGSAIARVQTGQMQTYGAGIVLGIIFILAGYYIWIFR